MGFLSVLKGFGSWVAKELGKLAKAAPQIEKIADITLAYVGPALTVILAACDPPAAAVVGPIFAEIQKDLHVASGLIYDFGSNPTAASIVSGVEAQLSDILAAGHIKDPALVQKIQMLATTIGSLATALNTPVVPTNGVPATA
jgi:hypothetical protein